MLIKVLGSAAGGGFPQWNCACPNCRGAREGNPRLLHRTQDSLAVSSDGESWFLFNASPDILAQVERFAALHPRGARDSPISGIVLTNGDLDHVLGLFSLRESQPLVVYSTEPVRRGLADNNVFLRTLERFPGQLTWKVLTLDSETALAGVSGEDSGLRLAAFAVPGKLPIHLEGRSSPSPEDNVGLSVVESTSRRRCVYVPGSAGPGDYLPRLGGADVLFFDGTFWADDELVRLGLSSKTAADMAHWPIGGEGGSLISLAGLPAGRKIYTHLNNTNPALAEDSEERLILQRAGCEVAVDGLEIA